MTAHEEAQAAATRAGVVIRHADSPEACRTATAIIDEIWPLDSGSLVDPNLLRALQHSGSYVALAEAEGEPVGVCLGFFSSPPDVHLHSHIAAVLPGSALRGVGYAMKLDQRAWALDRGVTAIEWTYDPLVRRNAWFNLRRLGGRVADYLVDFYGQMSDGRNRDFGSDRVLVHWDLTAPLPVSQPDGEPGGPVDEILEESSDGRPIVLGAPAADRSATVAVPADIEELRATEPDIARAWRPAVRETLGAAVMAGTHTIGVDDAGRYLLRHREDAG
ncbi:GNAT family N-acetyltransferase [Actinotalea sp. M2MS4P-6]|uniref:GNAT family N-acetyltransferase n=1 Tax=Actinotalea sp. M2MS4P-6 TaxID=2983762 RepID=UPI0021E3A954|nr:GNAT family N-acetyltransferase [Actinotalea sp. M2MS4P-6]MCV2395676.1 GNAT family N-acetyltransferase [Actinotalea sp. M2MS4P-6]